MPDPAQNSPFGVAPCGRQALAAAAGALGLTGCALTGLLSGPVRADPLLGSGRDVEGVRVYRDHSNPRLFYYAPGRLSLAMDRSGQPQISFLQMRYTGTATAGDRGAFRTMSNLTFRVRMEGAGAEQLARARAALRAAGGDVTLKPLPIRRVTAQLNYLPLKDQPAPAAGAAGLPAGAAKVEETEDPSKGSGYWTERYFALSPDDATSSLLWESFQKGRVLLSLGYAFYSDGIAATEPIPTGAAGAEPSKKGPHLVLADTLTLTLDAARLPDRIRRVDINESIPAQYAALSIACYDFNNALRPDLQVKVVEIEAKSVTGQPLKREAVFSAGSPELATASLRFPFAVSLRQGYRYRVHEITAAGLETVKPWKEGLPWTQLLDVTTPPEERPKPPPAPEDPS